MKTIEISGTIKMENDKWEKIILIQPDGLKVDLVSRIQEAINSFGNHKVQINYWTSETPKTKQEMMEGFLKQLFGDVDAEFCSDTFSGSSMTGSWTEEYTELKVGGHDLFREMKSFEGKFIIIDLNFTSGGKK